ncbi:MAG: hypothetical protein LBH41_02475, partial [Rickettsiales bacterium]|nr:hypothetical protein [Rickettsiales bacterium]
MTDITVLSYVKAWQRIKTYRLPFPIPAEGNPAFSRDGKKIVKTLCIRAKLSRTQHIRFFNFVKAIC